MSSVLRIRIGLNTDPDPVPDIFMTKNLKKILDEKNCESKNAFYCLLELYLGLSSQIYTDPCGSGSGSETMHELIPYERSL